MALIRISQIPPYDGEYEFDADRSFTTRELRWIKQIAGYLPRTLGEGLEGGDADVAITLAIIAMHRAGKIDKDEALNVAEAFLDIPLEEEGGKIQIIGDTEEEEAELPPASTPEPAASSPSESAKSQTSSGASSPSSSESQGVTQLPTGAMRSDTLPMSDQRTSVA